MLKSKRPKPTTVRPITLPAEKATLRAAFKLFFAAAVVRFYALTAIDIPIKPERPEKNPPLKKANGTNMTRYFLKAIHKSIKNTNIK